MTIKCHFIESESLFCRSSLRDVSKDLGINNKKKNSEILKGP